MAAFDVFLSDAHADRERVLELRDALVACRGAATVRGTKWLTEERRDGTLTSVSRSSAAFATRRRTVIVPAGRSYRARAQRSAIRPAGLNAQREVAAGARARARLQSANSHR